MKNNGKQLFSERVTSRIVIIALIFVIIGIIILLFGANEKWWTNNRVWQTLLTQIGSLLVVTATLTMAWELIGKRAFLDEVLVKAHLSRDIKFSGILQVTDSFHSDVDWKGYINRSSKIDIFFAYGHTWRQSHFQEFQNAAERQDIRIRVVLPDPEDADTVRELARRFDYTKEKLIGLIVEAREYFEKLLPPNSDNSEKIGIWFLPAAPTFTFYRFDQIGVLAIYTHRKKRVGVPTFVCERGGTLYEYIWNEFRAMISPENNIAKKVFP